MVFGFRIWEDGRGQWRWTKYDGNGRAVAGSLIGADDYRDCEAEARANGWDGTESDFKPG